MGSPTRPWRLGRSTCIGFGRPSHMQFMPNALQACAGELARLSRLFVAQAERWRLCKKTTLRRCLGRAGWSLVLLALGPVRQQMLSGGLLARGPAYGACSVSGASGGYRSHVRMLRLRERPGLPVSPWGRLARAGSCADHVCARGF